MSTYEYKALPDPRKYMRLLKLSSASDAEPTSLCAEVIVCRREEAPSYQPLSYTWGQQDASCSIWLRDTGDSAWKSFAIRPNLESCLKQLRKKEARILWIDAICINQTDNVEKGHQVATMDLVYRSQSIVIWLEEWSENSDVALDLLQSFRDCLVENGHEEFAWSSPLSDQVAKGGERFGETQTDESWAAFVDLINRPWFSRRWAVQEVVLSNQKHAHLGSRTFRLGYLVWLCGFLQLKSYHLRKELPVYSECRRVHGNRVYTHKNMAPVVDPIDTILRVWRAYSTVMRGDKPSLTLERLLDNFSALESFDTRDGVYAFLSMASDIDTEEWFPDYSDKATTTEIFAKATLHIVQKTGSLDIICRRLQDRSFSLSVNHPSSWIPWYGLQTINFTPDHSYRFHGYNTRSLTTFGLPLSTVRSGQEGYRPKPCPTGSITRCRETLFCDGCHSKIQGTGYECVDCEKLDFCYKCIGKASSVTTHHSPTHQFKAHNNAVYFASGHSVTFVQRYSSFQDNLRAACSKSKNHLQLVVGGFFVDTITTIGLGGVVQRHVNGFRIELPWENWIRLLGLDEITGLTNESNLNAAFLRALVGNRLLLEGERGASHLPSEFVKILHAKSSEGKWACDMKHTAQLLSSMEVMVSNDRRLATSRKYLGFVPPDTEVGDRIAILFGCSVPVVLRDAGLFHGRPAWAPGRGVLC